MLAKFEEGVEFDLLVGTFRGSALVVHGFPFSAVPRWRGVEANVTVHRDGTGSAEFSVGAWVIAGANTVAVQRATKLGILAVKVIAVGFHFEAGGANGNTVRADSNAMVISSLF